MDPSNATAESGVAIGMRRGPARIAHLPRPCPCWPNGRPKILVQSENGDATRMNRCDGLQRGETSTVARSLPTHPGRWRILAGKGGGTGKTRIGAVLSDRFWTRLGHLTGATEYRRSRRVVSCAGRSPRACSDRSSWRTDTASDAGRSTARHRNGLLF